MVWDFRKMLKTLLGKRPDQKAFKQNKAQSEGWAEKAEERRRKNGKDENRSFFPGCKDYLPGRL